jgi:3-(3-hydroxy-phenyl)propionate hydroxylase
MQSDAVAVLIVGAGPTGLTAANLLGQRGIATLLVERNTALPDFPRAISIDDEGLRIIQALGLGAAAQEHILLDTGAQYLAGQRLLVRVAPRQRRYGHPLISTFHQPRLERLLLAGLARFPCVEVLPGHTFLDCIEREEGIIARLRTPTGQIRRVACAYLLACDGGRSQLRRSLGIELQGTTFKERWLVIDAHYEPSAPKDIPPGPISFFCDPRRPAVSVPAPHAAWRWEFMLLPGEDEQHLLAPEMISMLLQRVGGPREVQIIRQTIYTFHAALARRFSQGRIFLLGDAAHLLPPFGGQGMNSGLRDAHNLAWKLALTLQAQGGAALLASYEQERREHVARMIRFSTLLGRLIMPTSRPLALARDITVLTLQRLPPIARLLSEAAIKPQARYLQGCLIRDGEDLTRLVGGRLLPQPEVLLLPERTLVLLDEVLGPDFALLQVHPRPWEAFAGLTAPLWKRLQARRVCLLPPASLKRGLPAGVALDRLAVDVDGVLTRFVRAREDTVVLVRPDRFVLGAFTAAHEAAFARRVERLFQG